MKFKSIVSIYCLSLFVIVLTSNLSAQQNPVSISEKEIQFETSFIEAKTLILNEKFQEAIDKLEKLFAEDRRNASVAFELAKCYNKQGDHQKSYDYLDRAIRFEATNPWFHLMKAKMLEEDARYLEAVAVYSDLIALDPDAFEFYKQKANNLARIERYQEAAETLTLFENRIGADEELHQRKYDLYKAAGMQQEAWLELKKLHLLDTENTDYLYLLASYAAQAGKQPEADSLLNVILLIDPSDTRAGLALSRQQKNGSSETVYLRSLRTVFNNKEANLDTKIIELIPYVEKLEPNNAELFNELNELSKLLVIAHPENAKVHSIRGDIFKLYRQYPEAISEYNLSLRYSQSVYEVWESLVMLEFQTGSIDNMLKTIDRALDYFPNQVNLYVWSGLGHASQQQYKKALSDLDQALMMSSGNVVKQGEIWQHKGAVFIKSKAYDQADQSFQKAIEFTQARPDILCYILYQTGIIKAVHPIAEKTLKSFPPEQINLPIYAALASRYYSAAGQFEKGTNWISKALIESKESDPTILEYAGDTFLLQNKQEEAKKYWNLAIQNGGDSIRINQKIKNMQVYE